MWFFLLCIFGAFCQWVSPKFIKIVGLLKFSSPRGEVVLESMYHPATNRKGYVSVSIPSRGSGFGKSTWSRGSKTSYHVSIPSRGSGFGKQEGNKGLIRAVFPSPRGEVVLESCDPAFLSRPIRVVSIPSRGSGFGKGSLLETIYSKGLRYPKRRTSEKREKISWNSLILDAEMLTV